MTRFAIICAVLLLCTTPVSADEKCQLTELASLPLTQAPAGELVFPISIAGKQFQFALAINQLFSQITRSTIGDLQLHAVALPPDTGLQSSRPIQEVSVPDVSLGNAHFKEIRILGVADYGSSQVAGAVAIDVLSRFDVELDVKGGKLNLFSQDHCVGAGVYWTDQAAALLFTRDAHGGLFFKAQLDGSDVVTNFSGGDTKALMDAGEARRIFGITAESPGVSPVAGSDSHSYTFKSLSIGGLAISNLPVELYPQKNNDSCFAAGAPQCSGS